MQFIDWQNFCADPVKCPHPLGEEEVRPSPLALWERGWGGLTEGCVIPWMILILLERSPVAGGDEGGPVVGVGIVGGLQEI